MPDFSGLIGKPFVPRARGPEAYDCWGLVIEVRRRLGLLTPDYDACFIEQRKIKRYAAMAKALAFDRTFDPQAGDIVELRIIENGIHFGVMIDRKHFLDITDDGAGVKVRNAADPIEKQLIAGFWRDRT